MERFELRDKAPEDLFKRLLKARQRMSLMGCSIDVSQKGGVDNLGDCYFLKINLHVKLLTKGKSE